MKQKLLTLLAFVMAAMTAGAFNLTVGTSEHGSIMFKVNGNEVTTASEGDVVTVVCTPSTGYVANLPSGEWSAGVALARRAPSGVGILEPTFTLTPVDGVENQWTFTMEAADATVSMSYKKLLSNSDISISNITAVTYNGQAYTPAITVSDGSTPLVEGTDYTVSYSYNVNASDTARVTITAVADNENYAGTGSKTFTISPKALETGFIAAMDTLVYTGSAQTPVPALTYVVGTDTLTLVAGTDFDVTGYENNTNAGNNAKVSVTGKGNYSGTANKTFVIAPRPVSASWIAEIPAQTWTGSNITPVLTVNDGNRELALSTDYTVKYANNKANGWNTASATITGKGNYKGTAVANFSILKSMGNSSLQAWAVSTVDNPIMYNGMQQTPPISVRDGRVTLVEGVDFTVEYDTNIAAGRGYFTVKGKEGSAYSGEKNGEFTINTRPIDDMDHVSVQIDSTALDSTIIYTGAPQEPKLLVTFTYNYKDAQGQDAVFVDTLLVGDNNNGTECDYYATYSDNTESGNAAKVLIEGVNNYSNDREFTFSIGKKVIHRSMFDSIPDTVYIARNIEPEPKVTFKVTTVAFETNDTTVTDSILLKGVDFEYTYANNRNAGTGTVYVTAKDGSNYEGSDSITFVINKAKALIDSVAVADTLTYNGLDQRLYRAAVVGGADSIQSGTLKYSLTYDPQAEPAQPDSIWADSVLVARNAGDYKVWYFVAGNSNHENSDTVFIQPKINKASLIATSVKPVPFDTLAYNALDQRLYTPGIVIGVHNDTIANAMKYSFDYDPEASTPQPETIWADTVLVKKNKGDYKVWYKVTGLANYEDWLPGDSLFIEMNIDRAQAAIGSIPVAKDSLVYSGLAQQLIYADSLGTVTGLDSIHSGEIYYSLTYDASLSEQPEGTWSKDIPVFTNAKDSIPVYYYVKGNDNHLDSRVDSVFATIFKADIEFIRPVADTLTYNAASQNLLKAGSIGSVSGVNGETADKTGTVYYTLKTPATASEGDWTTTVPQWKNAVDSIAVYFKVTAKDNYNDIAPDSVFAVINKAQADTLFAPKALELTYTYDSLQYVQDDTIIDAQALVTAGKVTGVDGESSGVMKYTLTPADSLSWSNDVPVGHDAGDYMVYYKIVGDSNHVDKAVDSLMVTIVKAQGRMSMAEGFENGYTGDNSLTYGDRNVSSSTVTSRYGYSEVNYVSSNPNVASVHYYTGEVTIMGAGDATITARMKDHKNFIAAPAIKYDIHVDPFLINDSTVFVEEVREGLPQITVEADAPKGKLKPEVVKDYELFYYDNPVVRNRVTEEFMLANPDEYVAVLTFFGNYEGFVEVPITVNPPAVVPGDITGTGEVTADDVEVFIDKLLEGDLPAPSDPDFESYDANGDGKVDIADAQAILNISLGLNWDGSLPNSAGIRANVPETQLEATYNVSAATVADGITRYTVTIEGNFSYTGFQMDARGSVEFIGESGQAVGNMRGNTMKDGTRRVVGYGSVEAYANGTLLCLDVKGEGSVEVFNVVLTTSAAQSVRAVAGTVTAITTVTTDKADVQAYDMSGRKVNTTDKKGVYIVNGKKVVRK